MRLFREAEEGEQAYGMVVCPVSDAEFDRIATEQGYVKLDVTYIDPNGVEVMKYRDERHVVLPAAELRERYVKRPVCGECGGTKKAQCECAHHVPGDTTNGCKLLSPCPSCGGTGFGRLVALDGIVLDAIRRHYEIESQTWPNGVQRAPKTETMVRFVDIYEALAAIDQEAT